MRGPLPDLRDRTPPQPPPPRTPSPPPRPQPPPRPRAVPSVGGMYIPVSDGSFAGGDGMIKRESLESPPLTGIRVPPPRPPPPRWTGAPSGPWNSPERKPAGGIHVTEVAEPQPPYGEVAISANPTGARGNELFLLDNFFFF